MSCKNCVFRSTFQDMGASCDICSWQTDLANAIAACQSSDTCRHRLTSDEAKVIVFKREGVLPVIRRETRPGSEPRTLEEALARVADAAKGIGDAINKMMQDIASSLP